MNSLTEELFNKASMNKSLAYTLLTKGIDFSKVETVCLMSLGHPYFYHRLKKEHPELKITVVEEYLTVNYGKVKVEKLTSDFWKDKHFDFVIMNPTVFTKKYLAQIKEALEHCEEGNAFTRTRWLTDPYKDYKNSFYKKYNSLLDRVVNIEEIKSSDYILLSKKKSSNNTGIYTFGHPSKKYVYSTLETRIMEKVAKYSWDNPIPLEENKKDGWRIKWSPASTSEVKSGKNRQTPGEGMLMRLRWFYDGKKDNKPWYNFYKKNQRTRRQDTLPVSIKFNSEEEARNFSEAMKTKFLRFVQESTLRGGSIHERVVPWMKDYSQPWSDKRFYDFFKLTQEEIGYVEDFVDNWFEKYK